MRLARPSARRGAVRRSALPEPRPPASSAPRSRVAGDLTTGARPKAQPVTIASSPAKRSARQLTCASMRRGVSAGRTSFRSASPSVATRTPAVAPRNASTTLSVISCRAMRRGRRAECRADARSPAAGRRRATGSGSRRWRRRSPAPPLTAASMIRKRVRTSPTSASWSGIDRHVLVPVRGHPPWEAIARCAPGTA